MVVSVVVIVEHLRRNKPSQQFVLVPQFEMRVKLRCAHPDLEHLQFLSAPREGLSGGWSQCVQQWSPQESQPEDAIAASPL